MPRSELFGLFDLMRGAPKPASVHEMRAGMEMFIPFLNANSPAVARVDEDVPIAEGVRADVIVPPGARSALAMAPRAGRARIPGAEVGRRYRAMNVRRLIPCRAVVRAIVGVAKLAAVEHRSIE